VIVFTACRVPTAEPPADRRRDGAPAGAGELCDHRFAAPLRRFHQHFGSRILRIWGVAVRRHETQDTRPTERAGEKSRVLSLFCIPSGNETKSGTGGPRIAFSALLRGADSTQGTVPVPAGAIDTHLRSLRHRHKRRCVAARIRSQAPRSYPEVSEGSIDIGTRQRPLGVPQGDGRWGFRERLSDTQARARAGVRTFPPCGQRTFLQRAFQQRVAPRPTACRSLAVNGRASVLGRRRIR